MQRLRIVGAHFEQLEPFEERQGRVVARRRAGLVETQTKEEKKKDPTSSFRNQISTTLSVGLPFLPHPSQKRVNKLENGRQ